MQQDRKPRTNPCAYDQLIYDTGSNVIQGRTTVSAISGARKIYTHKTMKLEHSKHATRKLLELTDEFNKTAGYRINTHKLLHFYTLTKKD